MLYRLTVFAYQRTLYFAHCIRPFLMRLLFATNNLNKFKEARKILPSSIILQSLQDVDSYDELPETGTTIKSNAIQKARYIYEKYGMDCFADDTGLEVWALSGRPGVYSARFAGHKADPSENIKKLLVEMKGVLDRRAIFRTVIALFFEKKEYCFEGHIDGFITEEPSGSGGFGYDPVFLPVGSGITFSEMNVDEKNQISHRGIALKRLSDFLFEREKMKS